MIVFLYKYKYILFFIIQIVLSYIFLNKIDSLNIDLYHTQQKLDETTILKKNLCIEITKDANYINISYTTNQVLITIFILILCYLGIFNVVYEYFFVGEELTQDIFEEITCDVMLSYVNRSYRKGRYLE